MSWVSCWSVQDLLLCSVYTPGTAKFLRIHVPIWLGFYVFVGWNNWDVLLASKTVRELGYVNADFMATGSLAPVVSEWGVIELFKSDFIVG